jgi:endonuclease YncB( thermonuclease family)
VNGVGLSSYRYADLGRLLPAKVVEHVDGDTVKVAIPNPPEGLKVFETIRMIGVDTPETVHPQKPVERFGKEASEFTRNRLLGKQVLLAFDWTSGTNTTACSPTSISQMVRATMPT